jgi:predicted nuclease of restriction endonuclease-like (RecB) superfamily
LNKKKINQKTENLEIINVDDSGIDSLYQKIKNVIEKSRERVFKTVNFETIKGYWEIGQYIVEDEQHGKKRASKGNALIKKLSEKLTLEYGSGFTDRNLRNMRQFYIMFSNWHAVSADLSWTHYRTLLKVDSEKARNFYTNKIVDDNLLFMN